MDPRHSRFETTRWTLVLAAGSTHVSAAHEALAELCQRYWYPLYAYARRYGFDAEDARDVVQGFILSLLERDDLRAVRPERGRFRAFLLVSLRHFMDNQRVHDRAQKRGGGQPTLSLEFEFGEDRYRLEPAAESTPETLFERNWALTVLDQVFRRIRAEWEARGKADEFDRLKGCLMGELPPGGYKALAAEIGTSEAAGKMAVQRLKRRFQEELRSEIADTATNDAVDDELRHLLKALRA
jgi:RNA polymerase sigma-70 factor (ECF subfamily)